VYVIAAVTPGVMQVAYSAASTTSADSTASGGVAWPEASRTAPAAIRHNKASKLNGSASETIRPILRSKVIGGSFATTDLTVRTAAEDESSVGCVIPGGR